MIIDSSVIVAMIKKEPGYEDYLKQIIMAASVKIPAPIFLESSIVLKNRAGDEAIEALQDLIDEFGIEIMPFTKAQVYLARDAFLKYGKGQGHPAQLNYGDCMAYAAARDSGMTLLFKGDDFAKTDVARVG